jgi:hypothetical protein
MHSKGKGETERIVEGSSISLGLTARKHTVAQEFNQERDNNKADGVTWFSGSLNAEPDSRGYDCRHESAKDCHRIAFATFRLGPYVRQGYNRVRVRTRVHGVRWVHCRTSCLHLQRVEMSTVVLVAEVRATAIVAKPIVNHSACFTRIHYLFSSSDN